MHHSKFGADPGEDTTRSVGTESDMQQSQENLQEKNESSAENKVDDNTEDSKASDDDKAESKPSDDDKVEDQASDDNKEESKASDDKAESKPSDDDKVEDQASDDNKEESKASDDDKEENKASDEDKAESKPSDDDKVEDQASDDSKEESKVSDADKAESKPSDDDKVEDQASDDNKEESKASDDKAESKPSDDDKVEDQASDDNKEESKASDDDKEENKASDEDKAESKPSDDDKVEDQAIDDNKEESKASDDDKEENKASDEDKAESKPSDDDKVEDQASDDNKEDSKVSDDKAESKPSDDDKAESKPSDDDKAESKASDASTEEQVAATALPQEEVKETEKPKSKIKLILGISAGIVIIILAIVAYIMGAPLREVKKYVLEDQLFVGSTKYEIDKKMLKSISNAKREKFDDGFFKGEQLSADIKLKTDEFKAEGQVYIFKLGKEVIEDRYDLEYTPLKGVNKNNISKDLQKRSIETKNIGKITLTDSNMTKLQVQELKDNLKERKSVALVTVELSEDIYKAVGNIEVEYEYKDGVWDIKTVEPKEFEFSYLPGKEFEFSIDEFVDYYNRGRYHVELAEGKKLSVNLDENVLSLDEIYQDGIYANIVTMKIDKKAPLYDVTGNVVVKYTYRSGEWTADKVTLDADYKFNIIGNYTGWYDSGFFTIVRRDAKLEITKVNDITGEYDGVFYFTTPDKPDEAGSYYVKGRVKINNANGDLWKMTGERWIDQPSGFSMVNLEGTMDNQEKKIVGDGSFYSNKFELTKID